MGIPSGDWYIDDTLTWTVNTHTVTTGAATDADSVPTYRIYEDETGTPILTGSMALLDGSNTAGLYSEQITLSAANGFEVGKSYAIYVAATVNAVPATQSFNFKLVAATLTAADIKAQVVAAINTDTYAEPGSGAPLATTTLVAKVNYLYKAWRNRVDQTASQYSLYADDGTTIHQKAAVSDDATTFTRAEIVSGP